MDAKKNHPLDDNTPHKPTWDEAKKSFEDAWNTLNQCDDVPSDKVLALTGLRVVLPNLVQQGLLHNYRYREISGMEQFNERLNSNRKTVHGADGSARIDVEIKTGGTKARKITPSRTMGMFDKIHTRVSSVRTVATKDLRDALTAYGEKEDPSLPFHFDGEVWNTKRSVSILQRTLEEAESLGLDEVEIPAILKPDRLTSDPSVKIVNFCLFLQDCVYPLLTVETTTEELGSHLSEVFEKAGNSYHSRMLGRSHKKAPSARDSAQITLRNLMDMGKSGRLVHLDTQVMAQRDLWMSDEVLEWALRTGTPEIRVRLERLIASRSLRQSNKPRKVRNVKM